MKPDQHHSIDDTEWQAQERSMRAVSGSDPAGMDSTTESYRIVAEALISNPRSEPPADFAASITARIAEHESRLERALWQVLLAAFAVAAIVTAVLYGNEWIQALHRLPGTHALGWVLVTVTCIALSWLPRQLRDLVGAHGTA